jgi:hypothetical protein
MTTMRTLLGNQTIISVEGREILTLRDILPTTPGLRILFVAKTPVPRSVEAGHYFQGKQGAMFWSRLKDYGLFKSARPFEDDSLLTHGFGLTDMVETPHALEIAGESRHRRGDRFPMVECASVSRASDPKRPAT